MDSILTGLEGYQLFTAEVSMNSSAPFALYGSASEDADLWQSLKNAIATSSGFQNWKSEQSPEVISTMPLEQLVRDYLRDTLETLAY